MTLNVVSDYVSRARTLLQDLVVPYRYSDDTIIDALNSALTDSRRMRPDMWVGAFRSPFPSFSSANEAATVPVDVQYQTAFLWYICGYVQMIDQEDTQDQRAQAFLGIFEKQLKGG